MLSNKNSSARFVEQESGGEPNDPSPCDARDLAFGLVRS
jgi:hypothetical protein